MIFVNEKLFHIIYPGTHKPFRHKFYYLHSQITKGIQKYYDQVSGTNTVDFNPCLLLKRGHGTRSQLPDIYQLHIEKYTQYTDPHFQ
jgi:predicted AlkP superfamily pyrophosphatase or phosphodiesterase